MQAKSKSMKPKEQPNWVTEYNHYSDIQKKDQSERVIRQLKKRKLYSKEEEIIKGKT